MSLVFMYIGKALKYAFVGGSVAIIYFLIKRKYFNADFHIKDIWKVLFISYVIALLSQTVFPEINYGIAANTGKPYLDIYYILDGPSELNLKPFHSILQMMTGSGININPEDVIKVGILNLLGNLVMFMPFGFLLPALWRKCEKFYITFLAGMFVSVGIEMIQYFIGRSTDVDDVILNSAGTVVGYICFICFRHMYKFYSKKSITVKKRFKRSNS